MTTAVKIEAATAPPSSGSFSDPTNPWCSLLYNDPRMDRMTIAKAEMTTQDQAFRTDTTGFILTLS
jgi:hypothetical protein